MIELPLTPDQTILALSVLLALAIAAAIGFAYLWRDAEADITEYLRRCAGYRAEWHLWQARAERAEHGLYKLQSTTARRDPATGRYSKRGY